MYTVDYFIKKFEVIPEKKWSVGTFSKVVNKEVEKEVPFLFFFKRKIKVQEFDFKAFCAQGHCMTPEIISYVGDAREKFPLREVIRSYKEWDALVELFGGVDKDNKLTIAQVNNGDDIRYQQENPKARVLAALYDMKRESEKTKEVKHVESIVPKTLKEQSADILQPQSQN